jgi:mRNA interferase MazF
VSQGYGRGSVLLVDLEPVLGSEQGRKRPCVVLSDLDTIRASGSRPLYFVVPLTTAGKLSGALAPQLKARAGGLPADSTALVMHARSIDPARIVKHWGQVDVQEIELLQDALKTLSQH